MDKYFLNKENNIISFKNVKINQLPLNFHIECSIDLRGSSIKELPQGLIIGGSLYIDNNIKYIPKDIIICKDLIGVAEDTNIPDNLIIGGELKDFSSTKKHIFNTFEKTDNYIFIDNTLVPYIKKWTYKNKHIIYNGIFKKYRVLEYHCDNGDVYYHLCRSSNDFDKYFEYDEAINRGLLQLDIYNLDSLVDIPTAAKIYKICTGACDEGIQDFIKSLKNPKDLYTIREIIDLTENQYINHDIFKSYFYNK